jgi:hypothetical protein
MNVKAICVLVFVCALAAAAPPNFFAQHSDIPLRAEVTSVPDGAELITYFQQLPGEDGGEMPLLAVLKDTLGDTDPRNDRLRQVWVFTYRPSAMWRAPVAAIPFFYMRAPLPDGSSGRPAPVLDMGDPSRGLWKRIAGIALQSQFLDGIGWMVRLASRSYGANTGEYYRMHVWQALDVLASAPSVSGDSGLSDDEMKMIQGRLELAGRTFGGLVSDEYLERAYEKARLRRLETRQSNWDLLRQRAEDNGLYFQPLALAGLPVSWAMLWVAEPEIGARREFDSKFLGISNPFTDASLKDPGRYSATWWLDEHGSRTKDGAPGAKPVRMLPLALYALDHPRAPLLLADMRRELAPKRTEMTKRFFKDVTTGVLGITGVGNWWYLGLTSGYTFVRARHGSPLDRSARLRAYVQVQHALAVDQTLPPVLRAELARRVDALNVNPLERNWARELQSARTQYQAFLTYALDPAGLARRVEQNRSEEAIRARHDSGERALLKLASLASLGIYRHREQVSGPLLTQVKLRRSEAWLKRQAVALPPLEPASGEATAGASTFTVDDAAQ